MVRPLTPDEIVEALDTWDIRFVKTPGWRTRSNQGGWGDVTGFMVHHTGTEHPDPIEVDILVDGHSTLPGPLAQFGLTDDGVVHLIAAGAANHAGGGDTRVLEAVMFESYDQFPPAPRFTHDDFRHGVPGSIIGNPRFMGVETAYRDEPTAKARATMPRLAAAMIWALDRKDTQNRWTAKSVIGHKEWQRGKPDPAKVDMSVLRKEIQRLLDAGPGQALGLVVMPERKWFLVPNIPRDNLEQIRRSVWTFPAASGPGAQTMWRMFVTMSAQLASLEAAVSQLAQNREMSAEEFRSISRDAAERAVQNMQDPAPLEEDFPEPVPEQPKGRGGATAPGGGDGAGVEGSPVD